MENCYKFSNTTIAIRFNLVQVSPSLPPFVLAVLFVHSFHVLSGYICFTRFGGGSHWLNFEKEFRDTAPLRPPLYPCSSWWIQPLLLLACATDQLNSGEVRLQNSEKQRRNPCSRSPAVYQDLTTLYDWCIKNAIVDLPIRLKGNAKRISGSSLSPLGGPEQKYRR